MVADPMRSASEFKRMSTFTKINNSAPPSFSLRATPAPNIPATAFITPFMPAPTPAPINDFFRQVMLAYMEDGWPPIPAQTPALVESKKQPLKA